MEELKLYHQWAVSGKEKAPYALVKEKLTRIGVTNLDALMPYEKAVELCEKHNMLGVGFVLTADDPFTVIDLDIKDVSTKDKQGNPHPTHEWCTSGDVNRYNTILEKFRSYTEISLSGKGMHIWLRGSVPKGSRRAGIEVYSDKRFIICTGNGIRTGRYKLDRETKAIILQKYPGTPHSIHAADALLLELYGELSLTTEIPTAEQKLQEDGEELYSDHLLVERGCYAENGEKFTLLCNGEWSALGYPSQSEADAALMSMFSYYSANNEQCKRLFRMSQLGRREKAVRNDVYLNRTLKTVRALNHDQKIIMETTIENVPIEEAEILATREIKITDALKFPPGFAGELAEYIYNSSLRPVTEVAITGALGMLAGLLGKAFPINDESGSNLYLTLVARSAIGKESMYSAIGRIVHETQKVCPVVTKFFSSDDFASGQALIKAVGEENCFLHMSSEWGRQLRRMSQDTSVDGPMQRLRTVMTTLHSKSGPINISGGLKYSNQDKNTRSVSGISYSIIGETTPGVYYDSLDTTMMEDGFLSRFIVIEYTGGRVATNRNRILKPSQNIIETVANLATRATNLISSQQHEYVHLDPIASEMAEEFDVFCDKKINQAGDNENFRQLWNRAHLHSLRVSALLAVADNNVTPLVEKRHFEWAKDLILRHIGMMARKFAEGNVGTSDDSRMSKLMLLIKKYTEEKAPKGINGAMYASRIIPRKYFFTKVRGLTSFTRHRLGTSHALDGAIKNLIDNGFLTELSKTESIANFKTGEKCYKINMII